MMEKKYLCLKVYGNLSVIEIKLFNEICKRSLDQDGNKWSHSKEIIAFFGCNEIKSKSKCRKVVQNKTK